MGKRFSLLFPILLLFLSLFICGCATAKGTAKGLANGVCAVGDGISEGAKKDWAAVVESDGWVKDNMW
ncbi:MAG: hypothetical protein PHT50_01630 [Candidatus Omnitrophica bacterium]|nr:hypothetical protein [Candidatus Omnitrophota bacterium]